MKRENKKKKEKERFQDDGASFTNMNIPGMPYYRSPKEERVKKELKDNPVDKKELRSLLFAGCLSALPIMLIMIFSFSAAIALIWLWFL